MNNVFKAKEMGQKPPDMYLIAEAGVNHEGDLNKAKEMIRRAAAAGADGIKFQTYKAEKLASKNSPAYWDRSQEKASTQYELFKKYDQFGVEEYRVLAEVCRQYGIDFLSTPFDLESAHYLHPLMPAFKIASSDLTNIPFLKKIARYEKPMLLSTGAATIGEIDEAVRTIEREGNDQIALLHCVLSYPTQDEDANLCMIRHLQHTFPHYVIGYSDHTVPDPALITLTSAAFLGAKIIEKHYTLDKGLEGNDHYHAMDDEDIIRFKKNMAIYRKVTGGSYYKQPLQVEKSALKYARRSLVADQDIPQGTVITEEMLTAKRPGTGISPKNMEHVLGKTAKVDMKEDDLVQWNMLA